MTRVHASLRRASPRTSRVAQAAYAVRAVRAELWQPAAMQVVRLQVLCRAARGARWAAEWIATQVLVRTQCPQAPRGAEQARCERALEHVHHAQVQDWRQERNLVQSVG
jgi:hypothetical protein